MRKENDKISDEDELRPEYDISELKGGVRGKYCSDIVKEQIWPSLRRKFAPHFRPMSR